MPSSPLPSAIGPPYTPTTVRMITSCAAAIAALDGRISVSPVARPWHKRAAWSGYTTALQLQGGEVDEIDVFSWGCGLKLPGRPTLSTISDPFEAFAPWQQALTAVPGSGWRNPLPATIREPVGTVDHPPLIRALDLVRQYARADASLACWLSVPQILCGLKLTGSPLPCLTAGVKAFRLKRTPAEADWIAALHSLANAARTGIERLDELERQYRQGLRALLAEYRPGALPRLLALSHVRPLVSPQSVADALKLSVAGASKLLDRAAAAGLLVEVSRRKTWRVFLTPDLAVRLGFVAPKLGRPRSDPPALPVSKDLADVLDRFDQEMAEVDSVLAEISSGRMPSNG